MSNTAVIAVGSNQGNRHEQLARAAHALSRILSGIRVSQTIETPPAPPSAPGDPPFLNTVVVGTTTLSARALLEELLVIERAGGRVRPYQGAPRTLDLDLILLGREVVQEPGLEVPHPRFRERRFVLEPLAALAPDLIDPVTGLTIADLLARLQ